MGEWRERKHKQGGAAYLGEVFYTLETTEGLGRNLRREAVASLLGGSLRYPRLEDILDIAVYKNWELTIQPQ